jgi:hypothetical protein
MGAMTMIRKTIQLAVAVAAAFAVTAVPGQGTNEGVARLKDVKGNVLVSRESGLAAGGEAVRLREHARVITTANSSVVVQYDNGCEVKLKENQRFEVEVDKPCAALIAQAQSILMEPAGATLVGGTAGVFIFWSTVPVLSGAVIGIKMIEDDRRGSPLSPS